MGDFRFPLVCFGGGGEGANRGGGFAGVNESGIVGDRGDVLGVSETATAENAVDIEGSKDRLVYDGEAVSHRRMSGISCRCILEMSDGGMESNLGGIVEGEGLGRLEGDVIDGVELGYLV